MDRGAVRKAAMQDADPQPLPRRHSPHEREGEKPG
jgi:hypothetical protein